MKHYLWQNKDWPDLTWSCEKLLRPLSCVRKAQGAVSALLMTLPEEDRASIAESVLLTISRRQRPSKGLAWTPKT